MRVDYAYRVKPGEQILVDASGGGQRFYVATVSAVYPSPVASGRDQIEITTTGGEVARLWADQTVTIYEQGEEQ